PGDPGSRPRAGGSFELAVGAATSIGSIPTMRRALVLGGGGVTGIAWEVGVIAGLAEAGVDRRAADAVGAPSAGAAVAAQVTGGAPLADLVARQQTPPEASSEIAADLDLDRLMAVFLPLFDTDLEPEQRRARVGAAALAAATV